LCAIASRWVTIWLVADNTSVFAELISGMMCVTATARLIVISEPDAGEMSLPTERSGARPAWSAPPTSIAGR